MKQPKGTALFAVLATLGNLIVLVILFLTILGISSFFARPLPGEIPGWIWILSIGGSMVLTYLVHTLVFRVIRKDSRFKKFFRGPQS